MTNSGKLDVRKLTYLSILTALVIVLQALALLLRFSTFSLTFVLVPMVIGVALCGLWAGAWLGAVFGIAVFITGDAALFLQFDIFGTIITVMLKGILAGLAAGVVYKLLYKVNRYLAVVLAAITTPIVNSGVFFLGCLAFFLDDIKAYFNVGSEDVIPFIITGFIGINFIIEFVVNMVLVPAVYRVIEIKQKK